MKKMGSAGVWDVWSFIQLSLIFVPSADISITQRLKTPCICILELCSTTNTSSARCLATAASELHILHGILFCKRRLQSKNICRVSFQPARRVRPVLPCFRAKKASNSAMVWINSLMKPSALLCSETKRA